VNSIERRQLAIAAVDAETIDRINIRQASLLHAPRRRQLRQPGFLLTTAATPSTGVPQSAHPRDGSVFLLLPQRAGQSSPRPASGEFDPSFRYGLARHKGYGCPKFAALERSPTPLHPRATPGGANLLPSD